MYAIFRANGVQFRAEAEQTIRLPSLDAEPGDKLTFDDVLLTSADGRIHVGTPLVEGASVDAEVLRHGRGDKIIVYKMKRRKGYRKKQGHRQGFTEVRIVDIAFPGGEAGKKTKNAKAEPEAPRTEARKPEAEAKKPDAEPREPEAATDEFDITDAARELAEENQIGLASIEGTGKDGRILKGDVEAAIKQKEEEG